VTHRIAMTFAASVGCIVLLLLRNMSAQAPDAARALVTVEGLKPAYQSCAIVEFSVRNTSRQDVYLEVYPEDFEGGSWKDVGCQYDLRDPKSRTAKRILLDPAMTRPGNTIRFRYDRCADYQWCARPQYPRGDVRRTRAGLQRADARATSDVRQRIRVEVYIRESGAVKRVGTVSSEPFARRPGPPSR
jgi:hypothetical protein